MKVPLAILTLAILTPALPCSAQTADMFIKSDLVQCWLDTKDVVHRHATGSIDDETSHSIKVERYASMQGTLAILVHVSADTDKKKGEGCRLYVGIIGQGGGMSQRGDSINAWRGGGNVRLVHQIGDEVMAMQKEREKKMKNP
jgi:hypothetical protein